ncbi:MAG: hypothetical protein CMF28_05870 [Kiritimatiellaceae bacterium]|nr:hypothetical protein [Kiritimatiellaceae bacterium]
MKTILLVLVMMCSSAFSQKAEDYRAAAEKGDAIAQFNLGVCYAAGKGVLEDDKQAVYWYTKAAEQGVAKAQFNLALCYAVGEGVTQDKVKAYAIFLHAKLNGSDASEVDKVVELLSLTPAQKEEGQQLAKTLFTD